jgi:hypothetical protein
MNEFHSISIHDNIFFRTNVFNGVVFSSVDVFNVVFFNVIICS